MRGGHLALGITRMSRLDDHIVSWLAWATLALAVVIIALIVWRASLGKNEESRKRILVALLASSAVMCGALGAWAQFLIDDWRDARLIAEAANEQLGLKLDLNGEGKDADGNLIYCSYTYSAFQGQGLGCSTFVEEFGQVKPGFVTYSLIGYFER